MIQQTSTEGVSFNTGRDDSLIMQSWELVDLDENGQYPPHGYCGLRHGDAQYFEGRVWKWQQVGIDRFRDPVFREIPIEEWDDSLHLQGTTGDYEKYGVVDAMGKMKWRPTSESGWLGIPLEDWYGEVRVHNQEPPNIIAGSGGGAGIAQQALKGEI